MRRRRRRRLDGLRTDERGRTQDEGARREGLQRGDAEEDALMRLLASLLGINDRDSALARKQA